MSIVDEQIAWWKANGWLPCQCWDAMGGSFLKLVVTWDDVRQLAGNKHREIAAMKQRRAA
jgi:hypothetical protein